jgi:hypothetical protein
MSPFWTGFVGGILGGIVGFTMLLGAIIMVSLHDDDDEEDNERDPRD